MMNNKEKQDIIENILLNQNIFKVKEVTNINFKPHPYTVGARHITYASNHNSGMLTEEVCKKVQCAHPRCNLSYEQHTSDLVCFLQLNRNCTNEEASNILKSLVGEVGEKFVDGFAFIDTKEKYRIE